VTVFAYVVYRAKFDFGVFEPRAALFPLVIGVPGLLLAVYIFAEEVLRSRRKVKMEDPAMARELEVPPVIARQRTIAIVGWIVGFFLAIWFLGFVAASAVGTFFYLKFGAKEKWPAVVGLTFAAWLFIYGVFDYGLQMPFPRGAVLEFAGAAAASIF
jgi:hypothetical protein